MHLQYTNRNSDKSSDLTNTADTNTVVTKLGNSGCEQNTESGFPFQDLKLIP